jgi:polygalacturonase
VKNYGAKGDGTSDDTTAINNTINATYNKGGGTVYIPDGTYMVNAVKSVTLKNNVNLVLSGGATLKALPAYSSQHYKIVNVNQVSNVSVTGGKIVGDRHTHLDTGGEWGMGINITGSNYIRVSNISISDCWGDGIYIGGVYVGSSTTATTPYFSKGVTIENFVLDHNRRNGISVISAKDLIIRNGTISNSNGTPPGSAIDLEPNYATVEYQLNISIENIKALNNGVIGSTVSGGWGLDAWFGAGGAGYTPSNRVSVDVINLTGSGNYRGTIATNIKNYITQGYDIVIK